MDMRKGKKDDNNSTLHTVFSISCTSITCTLYILTPSSLLRFDRPGGTQIATSTTTPLRQQRRVSYSFVGPGRVIAWFAQQQH